MQDQTGTKKFDIKCENVLEVCPRDFYFRNGHDKLN